MNLHFCTLTATAIFRKEINFNFPTATIKTVIESLLKCNDNECLVDWVLEELADRTPGYKLPENCEDFDGWIDEGEYPNIIKFRDQEVHFSDSDEERFDPTAKDEIIAIFKEMGLQPRQEENYIVWYRP